MINFFRLQPFSPHWKNIRSATMSLISKDIASIIAKYNTPTPVYVLLDRYGFKKYVAIEDINVYIKILFDNRYNEEYKYKYTPIDFNYEYDWIRSLFNSGALTLEYAILNDYDNVESFTLAMKQVIKKIDIEKIN